MPVYETEPCLNFTAGVKFFKSTEVPKETVTAGNIGYKSHTKTINLVFGVKTERLDQMD